MLCPCQHTHHTLGSRNQKERKKSGKPTVSDKQIPPARDTSYFFTSYFVLFSPSSPFISSKGSHLTYYHTPHSTIFLSHFPTSLLSLHISPTPRPTSFSLHTLPHRRFLCSFSAVLLFCEQENIHCLTGVGKRRWVVGSCPPEIRWGRWWLGIGSRNSA